MDFITLVSQELYHLQERLEILLDEDEYEIDFLEEVLYITTKDSSKFVLNKHLPTKQIWLSSPVSGAHHFSYCSANNSWQSTTGKILKDVLNSELGIKL